MRNRPQRRPLGGIGIRRRGRRVQHAGGYSLVSANCGEATRIVVFTAMITLALAVVGGLLSAPAWFARSAPGIDETPERAAPRGMIAGVSVLAALLFSLVIVLQGAAGLILQGCQI